jgi:fos-like antigen
MRTVPAPGDKIDDEEEAEEEERKLLKFVDDKQVVSIAVLTTTPTTPTLTPTRLVNIEEDFFHASQVQPTPAHENQAKFVPPLVRVIAPPPPDVAPFAFEKKPVINVNPTISVTDPDLEVKPFTLVSKPSKMPSKRATERKRKSGQPPKDETEEELRRRLRRERNKQAAARCRQRRQDQTVSLQQETEVLEEKQQALRNEILALQSQKAELERILAEHVCLRDQKPVVAVAAKSSAPVRPTSLALNMALTSSSSSSSSFPAPVPMDLATSTPSKGLNLFNSPSPWTDFACASSLPLSDTINTPVVDNSLT